jgi:hypothetical protein
MDAEPNSGDISTGGRLVVHDNPLSVVMHGREMMAHPVFDHELSSIQGSTIVGGVGFGLGCLTLGTYVNYSIALQTGGLVMDVQTRASYIMLAWGSKWLTVFFGVITLWQYAKLWRQIRHIKRAKGVFSWTDAEGWVKVKAAEIESRRTFVQRVKDWWRVSF